MATETDPETTAAQDAWVEIAEAIRGQIRKAAEYMPAMKPDELKTFIEAAQAALWLEEAARTTDSDVDLLHKRLAWAD